MKFRTTKKIATSLHNDDTFLIEFNFNYHRKDDTIKVVCDAYQVEEEGVSLICGGGSKRVLQGEELNTLMALAKTMTTPHDNPLTYVDNLISHGVQMVIVNEKMWKNQLTINDFEV